MSRLLYSVSAFDPATFAGAACGENKNSIGVAAKYLMWDARRDRAVSSNLSDIKTQYAKRYL